MKNSVKVIALILCIIILPACSYIEKILPQSKPLSEASSQSQIEEPTPPEYPISAGGITLESQPLAVVSLAQSLTEKIYDLELEDQLVGVSAYCKYPSQALDLPNCGTSILLDIDQILALEPALVITDTPLTSEDIDILSKQNIQVAVLPNAISLNRLYGVYSDIARLLQGDTTGTEIGEKFVEEFENRLDEIAATIPENGGKEVLYLRLLEYTVATGDTVEHELMEKIGLKNIAKDYTNWNYPQDIAISTGKKDFESISMIFCDELYVNIKMLEQNAYYKSLPAVLKDWYFYIDAQIFESQGLRILDEIESMAAAYYPELKE